MIQITTPPVGAVTQNPTFAGVVTDSGTGVALLEAQVDSGQYQPVAFNAGTSNSLSRQTCRPMARPTAHVVRFRAIDWAGNVSAVTTEQFTLIPASSLYTFQSINFPARVQRRPMASTTPARSWAYRATVSFASSWAGREV